MGRPNEAVCSIVIKQCALDYLFGANPHVTILRILHEKDLAHTGEY